MSNFSGKENLANPENQPQDEPVIQEVYEPEPDDYNYELQLREVDDEEIRNLSALRVDENVDRRVYYVSAMFVVAALIGGIIGLICASSAATTADIERKASIARQTESVVSAKLEGFKKFEAAFAKIENGNFEEQSFMNELGNYNKLNFMLDISSEITSEIVLLAGDKQANPLKGLREYSANTMLLTQLLSNHINETKADAEAIAELQNSGDSKVIYAMQVLPDAIYYLGTEAPRSQYANGVMALFTHREAITDDAKTADVYANLKTDFKWSEMQRMRRDYVPGKGEKLDADMVLPNRMIYTALDRSGNQKLLFADELILVDRQLLFGKSANAKERYEQRNQLIRSMIDEAKKASAHIVADLNVFVERSN